MSRRIHIIVGVLLILLSRLCIASALEDAKKYGVNVGFVKCDGRLYNWEDITFSVKKACGRFKSQYLETPKPYSALGDEKDGIRGPFFSFPLTKEYKLFHRPTLIRGSNDLVILNMNCKFIAAAMNIKLQSTRSRLRLNRSCPPGRNDCEQKFCEVGATKIPGLNKSRPGSPVSSKNSPGSSRL